MCPPKARYTLANALRSLNGAAKTQISPLKRVREVGGLGNRPDPVT